MNSLSYSISAQNILNLFYNTDYIVYVEGKDDIPFWENMFCKFTSLRVEIQDVGSCTALNKYIDRIKSGELSTVIVACDSDFTLFEKNTPHPKIIKTFGHSIENSLISEQTITKVIKSLGRIPNKLVPKDDISNWLKHIDSSTCQLTMFEIFNHVNKCGLNILGDNCSKLTTSRTSPTLCQEKIDSLLGSFSITIDNEFEVKTNRILNSRNMRLFNFLRGHFLFSATLKFISSEVKKYDGKISLSKDALFTALLLAYETSLNSSHNEFQYYNLCFKQIENVNKCA
ncbi:DUF4435 domain-containing protein [Aeromonas veronii]|uniref:DUF4435 domain-containing protein n=1 Tax=Aeromonas veronii TaxID=654 RepID=UPI0015E1B2DD|nr:DUF4435 domain-containing protein [Aeromonas veronii]